MQIVDFVATENIKGEVELDLTNEASYAEACKTAESAIKQMYPTYDNVEVIGVRTLD